MPYVHFLFDFTGAVDVWRAHAMGFGVLRPGILEQRNHITRCMEEGGLTERGSDGMRWLDGCVEWGKPLNSKFNISIFNGNPKMEVLYTM